jgi:hypothetical protein
MQHPSHPAINTTLSGSRQNRIVRLSALMTTKPIKKSNSALQEQYKSDQEGEKYPSAKEARLKEGKIVSKRVARP